MRDIQRGDREARRTALVILALGTVLGAGLIALMQAARPDVENWLAEDLDTRAPIVLAALGIGVAGPALVAAVYLLRLASRTRRARRFPPPGARVIRDTAVIAGAAALRRAWLLVALAVLLIGVAAVLLYLLWRLQQLAPAG